jgi:hypothetical protein
MTLWKSITETATFEDESGADLDVSLSDYEGYSIRLHADVPAYTGSMSRHLSPATARALAARLTALADEADIRNL